MQTTRGTFGSTGTFEPFTHKAADGLAMLDWLVNQPWCDQRVALFGPSYLGLVHWAVTARSPSAVKALAVQYGQSVALVLPYAVNDE